MAGITRLKSRQKPPWGGTMEGIWAPALEAPTDNWSVNVNLRFFTPDTSTEIGRAIAGAYGQDAHLADDTANVASSANASNTATAITLLNEIKGDFNAHIASTTFHVAADATNGVTSADATDEASALTLANEIKEDLNAHWIEAGVHVYNDVARNVTAADATNEASLVALSNDIKLRYNNHRTRSMFKFTVYGIAPGTYDIGGKIDFCISKKIEDQSIVAGATTVVYFGVLIHADVNASESMSAADSAIASQIFFNLIGDGNLSGDFASTEDWRVPQGTEYGVWSAVSTARRRTY